MRTASLSVLLCACTALLELEPPARAVIGSDGGCSDAEICNGYDDDCDGVADEDTAQSCFDGPAEALGVGPCASGQAACVATAGSGEAAFGPCGGQVTPQPERCNGRDDDCDGVVDADARGPVIQACYPFAAGEPGVGICRAGVATCRDGAFGVCLDAVGPQDEVPDDRDQDCDGRVE